MAVPHSKSYILGIDIGTTSVKTCLFDTGTKRVMEKHCKDTNASVPSDDSIDGDEQDVVKIYSALTDCMSRMSSDNLRHVVHLGVCGQMHGVVYWKEVDYDSLHP